MRTNIPSLTPWRKKEEIFLLNIEANRLELLSAAQDAEKLAPTNSPVKVLECAFLTTENEKLTVCAGNLEVSMERHIPVSIHEEGTLAIDARLLSAMLRLLGGDTVSLAQRDNASVTLTADDATFTVMTQDPKEYPRLEIPFPEDTVTVSGLPAMTRRTVFAVGNDEKRPVMKCVHLSFAADGLKAVSSDGLRIASVKGQSKGGGSVDILLPATPLDKLAQLVSNKDELQVGITNKTVVFMKEGFLFSTRMMEGEFVNTDMVLNNARPNFILLTDADALRQEMGRVYTVTGNHARFSMSFTGTAIKMTCDSEYGSSSTEMDVVPLTGSPNGTYWYSPSKLYECLRALSGNVMLKVCQAGALVMETDEVTCMQMSMREPKVYVPKPVVVKKEEPKAKKPRKKKNAEAPQEEAA